MDPLEIASWQLNKLKRSEIREAFIKRRNIAFIPPSVLVCPMSIRLNLFATIVMSLWESQWVFRTREHKLQTWGGEGHEVVKKNYLKIIISFGAWFWLFRHLHIRVGRCKWPSRYQWSETKSHTQGEQPLMWFTGEKLLGCCRRQNRASFHTKCHF